MPTIVACTQRHIINNVESDVFPLPPCVWHEIALLIYEEDFEPHRVLAKRLALMLISKEIAALTYRVPVQLDLRCASDVSLVKKVLSSTPVSKLWLRYDIRGDEILRDADVRWQSSGSLRELSASISCTDTLQAFFNLQKLHLQAHVLPKLYPAVLCGMAGLQHLSLHFYEDFCLSQLPHKLVASVKHVEVTPKPVALHSHFTFAPPHELALNSLTLHGSFHEILSHKAAPRAVLSVAAMCWRCKEVRVEAEDVVFDMDLLKATCEPSAACEPAECSRQRLPSTNGVQALAGALLGSSGGSGGDGWGVDGGGASGSCWQRLEFWVLGSFVLPCMHAAAGAAAAASDVMEAEAATPDHLALSPEKLAEELQQALLGMAGQEVVRVSVRRQRCSIFEPAVLLIERIR